MHTVVLFHSIVSGKRKILYDNDIIFEHKNLGSRIKEMVKIRRSGLMDHAWSTNDGHLLRLTVDEKFDGFTYDLIIDGQPYSNMVMHPVYGRNVSQLRNSLNGNSNYLTTAKPTSYSRGSNNGNNNNNNNNNRYNGRSSYNDDDSDSDNDFDSFSNNSSNNSKSRKSKNTKRNSKSSNNDFNTEDSFDAFDAFATANENGNDDDGKKKKDKKRKKRRKKEKEK